MPVNFTRLGKIIKAPVVEGGCGVELELTAAKRDHYLGIALVTLAAPGRPKRLGPGDRRAGRLSTNVNI